MEQSFWQQRWKENRIGFHLSDINQHLLKHFHQLNLHSGDSIFVPLCGKSRDLQFFRQNNIRVVANELSPIAVKDWFFENNIAYTTTEFKSAAGHNLLAHHCQNLDLYQGDFFSLNKDFLGSVQAVYDRAALVALPEKMRQQYVDKLINILPERIKILLITLEYDQSLKQGPPFSVTEQEVYRLYQKHFTIQLLSVSETPEKQRSETSQGLSMIEKVYLLDHKSSEI